MSPKICKECGAQVPLLVSRKGRGVCQECAIKIDKQSTERGQAIISLLLSKHPERLGLTEIQTYLQEKGEKVALSSLHILVTRLVEERRIARSGTQYFVEASK